MSPKKLSAWMTRILQCLSAMIVIFSPLEASAEDPSKSKTISLFNGKDLTGWKASEMGEFAVEDGCLVVRGKKAHLFTEKEFKNVFCGIELAGLNEKFGMHHEPIF